MEMDWRRFTPDGLCRIVESRIMRRLNP